MSVGAIIVIAIAATGILLMRFRKRWLAKINIAFTNLWLANCYFAHNSLEFPVLLGFCERDLVVLFIHFIATLARMLHKELTAVTSRS